LKNINSNLLTGVISAFIGIIGGVSVSAYSAGQEKARLDQKIAQNTTDIDEIKSTIGGRLYEANQTLTQSISKLETQVQVLSAIVVRIEQSNNRQTK
jgi:hypothetical protein